MAIIEDQNIPAELLELYQAALSVANPIPIGDRVSKRIPFHLPRMQSGNWQEIYKKITGGATFDQRYVREMFARAVYYFNLQPYSGGVTPPAIGYRNRSWWYAAAGGSGLWYFNYFMQQTLIAFFANLIPDWCKIAITDDASVDNNQPDRPWWVPTRIRVRLFDDSPYYYAWAYVKITEINHYLWLYFYGCANGDCETQYYTVGLYETTDVWNPATITWNTKPAVGAKISEVTFRGQQVWLSMFIPDVPAVVLKLEGPVGYMYDISSSGNATQGHRIHLQPLPHW